MLDDNSFIYQWNCLSETCLTKNILKNQHVNGLLTPTSDSYNIPKPNLIHSKTCTWVWHDHTKPLIGSKWWEPSWLKEINGSDYILFCVYYLFQ